MNEIKKYELKYNNQECEAIAKTLVGTLDQIPIPDNTDEKDYFDLMCADIKRFIQS